MVGARWAAGLSQAELAVDVLIGAHEVLLAVRDRRGHPFLAAGVVVDDPDFVSALRERFDKVRLGRIGAGTPARRAPG